MPETPVAVHHASDYEQSLMPGSLWRVQHPIQALVPSRQLLSHELRYVIASYADAAAAPGFVPPGTVAVYAGTVRVQEETRDQKIVSINRHTFIIGGVRYMTTNLNLFSPVGED